MRVAAKFFVAFMACGAPVIAISTWAAARRELERYEADLIAHQSATGRALRPGLVDVWQRDGEARALSMLGVSDRRIQDVDIRWVWLSPDAPTSYRPRVDLASLAAVVNGEEKVVFEPAVGGVRRAVTYVPVRRPGQPAGAIELSETMPHEREILRAAVRTQVTVTGAVALLVGALATALSAAFVGRPVAAMRELARRVGAGDLSTRLRPRRRDELADLGRDIDAMCDQLAASQALAGAETEARIAAIAQLRHADRVTTVGKLASGIAHELGTPLNVIAMRAKMVATGEVRTPEDIAEYAGNIATQAERMTRIVRQLLDFARRGEPRRGAADLRRLLMQTARMLDALARRRGVVLDAEPGDAAVASVDAGQLEQVVTNLAVNAVQASPSGGRVRLDVREALRTPPPGIDGPPRPCVCLRVSDQGVGIQPDVLDRIFEPFFTTKDVGDGTGLGLSVAWGIVRDHGGWIDVETEPGRGSTFTICLPTEDA